MYKQILGAELNYNDFFSWILTVLKKLLYQIDSDARPSIFDNVVAYDGGADQVIPFGGVLPQDLSALAQGAIFTRAPKDKKNTAFFIGGSNLQQGEALLEGLKSHFYGHFSVSVMLDSNGANTTASALVAMLSRTGSLAGLQAVVMAGTGPVGQRVSTLLALEGCNVTFTGRDDSKNQSCAQAIAQRFGLSVRSVVFADTRMRQDLLKKADIIVATGASGVILLSREEWSSLPNLKLLADASAAEQGGIEGIGQMDKGVAYGSLMAFGAIGFGPLKLAIHRACVAQLFESNKQVLDVFEIYAKAKELAGQFYSGGQST